MKTFYRWKFVDARINKSMKNKPSSVIPKDLSMCCIELDSEWGGVQLKFPAREVYSATFKQYFSRKWNIFCQCCYYYVYFFVQCHMFFSIWLKLIFRYISKIPHFFQSIWQIARNWSITIRWFKLICKIFVEIKRNSLHVDTTIKWQWHIHMTMYML